MQPLAETIHALSLTSPEPSESKAGKFDWEAYEQERVGWYNQIPGDTTSCPVCNGKGHLRVRKNGSTFVRDCECLNTWKCQKRMERSGLGEALEKHTFANFRAEKPFQTEMLLTAHAFVEAADSVVGPWLFVGGAAGSGKTHICTAACGELLKRDRQVMYMLWQDESVRLKSCVNDDDAYQDLIFPYKQADVLYIDDLFKTQSGESPTKADVRLAFEIINYRYQSRKRTTIASSEMDMWKLLLVDEALGSRFCERASGYCVNIAKGDGRNQRLNGGSA